MLIRRSPTMPESEVTELAIYHERRKFIKAGAALGLGLIGSRASLANATCKSIKPSLASNGLTPNTLSQITSYNNYYEFSNNKRAIRILAQELTVEPWTLTIEGEVKKTLTIDMEQLTKRLNVVERIYPLRCVEGWSMVIPWNGVPLCKLLALAQPTSHAKFVEFVSLYRPEEMIGQRHSTLEWPYREGLRIDEAMHPLTLMATGLYGDVFPKQNGAPLRLVVPWKYGFKSAKAITHIRLLREQPETSWNQSLPGEYGFYANVNPAIPHSRWSQRRENRIGEAKKRPTLPFNGYAEEVAGLYHNMDLRKHF